MDTKWPIPAEGASVERWWRGGGHVDGCWLAEFILLVQAPSASLDIVEGEPLSDRAGGLA